MYRKKPGRAKIPAILLLVAAAALVLLALPNQAYAASTNNVNSFCNEVIPPQTQFGISGIINITLLVLLSMIAVIGIVAAIGYAFDIGILKRFMRNELGEIAITVIIAMVVISTLSADGSLGTGYVSSLTGVHHNLFYQDCNALSIVAVYQGVPALVSIGSYTDALTFISSMELTYAPNGFGVLVSPYAGASVALIPINNMFALAGGLVGLLIAVPVILGIIYGLFPLFFYAGLVLRILPWTRAAGGAFLGMFAGLYIVFPLLLHAMMCTGNTMCTAVPVTFASIPSFTTNIFYGIDFQITALYNIASFFIQYITNALGSFNQGIIASTLSDVVAPVAFMLFDVFISFIVALDFSEAMGDYLGAQSLSGTTAFKKLI